MNPPLFTPGYRVEVTSPTRLFTDECSWSHPRAGAIPPGVPGNESGLPLVVMTMQEIELCGSDIFRGLKEMRTSDLGKTWSEPVPIPRLDRRTGEGGREVVPADFTPRWHAASGKLLGTGALAMYEGGRGVKVRPASPLYAVCDPVTGWSSWEFVGMPEEPRFYYTVAGCTQRYDLPNGDVLLPVYFKGMEEKAFSCTVVRCGFDGTALSYLEHGSEHTVGADRGAAEPSITFYDGRFYLTIRNDQRGYVAVSDDGLYYREPQPWLWDDGGELGSYNTQQHWVTHRRGLFLAYTRRGANNDHVMRNRAPLFIAQVDPQTLRVIRSTERELMPNRGARLGNFAVTEVSENETWVTDAEWMQPRGCEKYGCDGAVWVSRIHWETPNAF